MKRLKEAQEAAAAAAAADAGAAEAAGAAGAVPAGEGREEKQAGAAKKQPAEQPLVLDLRKANTPGPSLSTLERELRDFDAPAVGLQHEVIRTFAQECAERGEAVVLAHDDKAISAGYQQAGGVLWGETDFAGLRVAGKPDRAEREVATAAARAKVDAAVVALQDSAARVQAGHAIDSKQLAAMLSPAVQWLDAAQPSLGAVKNACAAKEKAKEKRIQRLLRKKQISERKSAAEQGRDEASVKVTSRTSMQQREWQRCFLDSGLALTSLVEWLPRLRRLVDALAADAPDCPLRGEAVKWKGDQQSALAAMAGEADGDGGEIPADEQDDSDEDEVGEAKQQHQPRNNDKSAIGKRVRRPVHAVVDAHVRCGRRRWLCRKRCPGSEGHVLQVGAHGSA
jgi:hypothetical protein